MSSVKTTNRFCCVKLFLTNSSTLLSRSFHRNSQHPKDSKLNAPNSPQQKEIEVFTEYACIEKKFDKAIKSNKLNEN